MHSRVTRVGAAVVFLLAIAGVAVWFHGGGATLAFADFVRPILEAKTAKYKQTVEMKGPPAMTITSQEMVLDATRSRSEIMLPDGRVQSVQITDWSKGVSLCLIPAMKHATILEYANTRNARNDPALGFGCCKRLAMTRGKTSTVNRLAKSSSMGAASWGSV